MIENVFSKQFPKLFVHKTEYVKAQMYVTYLRRPPNDGSETATWTYRSPKGASITGTVDNSWIVSYCPVISVMFQCRLNVELCVSEYVELSTCSCTSVVAVIL